jgi:hypothetical protein
VFAQYGVAPWLRMAGFAIAAVLIIAWLNLRYAAECTSTLVCRSTFRPKPWAMLLRPTDTIPLVPCTAVTTPLMPQQELMRPSQSQSSI